MENPETKLRILKLKSNKAFGDLEPLITYPHPHLIKITLGIKYMLVQKIIEVIILTKL